MMDKTTVQYSDIWHPHTERGNPCSGLPFAFPPWSAGIPDWKKIISAVREAHTSRHDGAQLRAPLEPI